MKLRFWTAASAAALSVAVVATGPALSQTSLRQNVTNQLAEHKITVENLDSMSNTDLAEIQLLLNTTEGSDATKRAMIEDLFAEQRECEGNPQLRQQVAHQLKEHRIEVKNFDNVTGTQLVVVKTVLDSSGSDAEKRAQIERVFAAKRPISGGDYLRADAEQCVRMVGADVDLDDLTPDQLLQIQLIAGGSDDANTKRQMIESLAK
jgi:hypothetical protein